jgi:hypothetical protein
MPAPDAVLPFGRGPRRPAIGAESASSTLFDSGAAATARTHAQTPRLITVVRAVFPGGVGLTNAVAWGADGAGRQRQVSARRPLGGASIHPWGPSRALDAVVTIVEWSSAGHATATGCPWCLPSVLQRSRRGSTTAPNASTRTNMSPHGRAATPEPLRAAPARHKCAAPPSRPPPAPGGALGGAVSNLRCLHLRGRGSRCGERSGGTASVIREARVHAARRLQAAVRCAGRFQKCSRSPQGPRAGASPARRQVLEDGDDGGVEVDGVGPAVAAAAAGMATAAAAGMATAG